MTDNISEPVKVGETFRLTLHSQNATTRTDNSFDFKVDLKDIEGDIVRCAVSKVRYPPPATYTSRRLWFADGNTFFKTYTYPQTNPPGQKVNDYETLYAKYGNNNFMYMYYPLRNIYMRLFWNSTASGIVRQTLFSVSLDGVNWSGNGNLSNFGMVISTDYSGAASVPFDFYEIDINTLPVGTNMQNINCPQLKAAMSYDTTTNNISDVIGNIVRDANSNPYVVNDNTNRIVDEHLCHELSGSALRAMPTINLSFSRVATPTIHELVVMPWFVELEFFKVV